MTIKLTDTQRVILSTAAERDDRRIWPFSQSLKANAAALSMSVKSLLERGLIVLDPGYRGHPDKDVGFEHYIVTDIGLAAIGIEPETSFADDNAEMGAAHPQTPAKQPKQGSKLGILVEHLRRPNGATLAELVDATGWQSHSVRGAISGTIKRKMGLAVETQMVPDRGRIYRVVEGAAQ
jgi:hypothetical protein